MNKKYLFVIVAILSTAFAKIIGFIRELVIAYIYGTSSLADVFLVAFLIPDLLITGINFSITVLYIPFYYNMKSNNDIDKIKKFNFVFLFMILSVSFFFVMLCNIFPSAIVGLFVSGFDYEKINYTANLLRVVIISAVPILCASWLRSYMQINNKFSLSVLLSSVTNVVLIIALLFYGSDNIVMIAFSVIWGNVIYCFLLWKNIEWRELYYGFKITSKKQFIYYYKLIINKFFPVFISSLIDELNQVVDKNFASYLAEGTIAALNYSSKIINVITAVIGTAISGAIFSKISNDVADGKYEKIAKQIVNINALLLASLLPIIYFIAAYSENVISLLYAHGAFDDKAVIITSECLCYYLLGILGFNFKAIWIRVYNAHLDTRTPAYNSLVAVVLNIIFNAFFVGVLEHKGLALATSFSSIFTTMLLILHYKKKNCFFNMDLLRKEFLKIFSASVIYFILFLLPNILWLNLTSFVVLTVIYVFLLNLFSTIPGVYIKALIFNKGNIRD